MDIVIEQINSVGKTFVDFAWPMLWQASVLIAILLAADFLLRRKVRAVFRYWLWMLVLAKLFLPTTLSSPVSIGLLTGNALPAINIAATEQPVGSNISNILPNPPRAAEIGEASVALHAEAPIQSQAVTPAASLTRQGGIFLVWLVVVCAMLLLLMQRAVFVCGLVRQSAEATGLMNDALKFCCNQMGVRQTIGLKISPNATSPAVCGLFRPVILVPQGLGSSLGINSLRVVLMHELAHIKRGDLWVNLVQTLLQIVYFYNPLLWLANWVIRRVREQAVDEAVQVALGEKAQQYPETLLNVARLAFERPALSLRLIGVVESKSALTSRIKRMLNQPIPKTAKLGIIGSLALILLAAVLLPMAKAKDVYSATGENKSINNLQSLIDSAQAGGTVVIPEGVYTEPIKVTKPVTLKGQSRDGCIFEVMANEPAIRIDTAGKGKVTLENVTIKWQLATSDKCEQPYAVAVKDTTTHVTNCRFEPMGNFERCPTALQAVGFSQLSISGCRFEGFGYTVCFGEGTKGVIEDCLVMDSGHQGVSVYSNAEAKVVRNVISGSLYHGVRCTGGKIDLRGNLIIGNKNRGVYLGNKNAGGTIANNVIFANESGISGFSRSDVEIKNNVIAKSSYAAIDMEETCRLSIGNNIFAGNERGISVHGQNKSCESKVLSNTFWQNKTDTENIDKLQDSINADPGFIDMNNGDFSLKQGSVKQAGQGLTSPAAFKKLWQLWQNRRDKKAEPVVSAVEFGDTNGANAGKDNHMDKPEKKGTESAVGHIDLLKQYPTTLTGKSTNPQDAREWQFTPQDIYSISRFSFDVNNALQVKIDSADIGIGHCKDGAVWAVVIPRELGTIKSLTFGEEPIDHLWLRFHPREVLSLFPKDTIIAGGDKNLWGRMNGIAKAKMNSSWQAGGLAMIPAPKDFTVDADTKKNVRRFFIVDSEAKTAEYVAAFEGRTVPVQTSSSPPIVIKTTPEAFVNDVSSDLNNLTVTFNQQMMDRSWSWTGGGETYPATTGQPGFDRRRMTCGLPVNLEAGKVYWVGINSPSFQNFKSASGVPAKPYVVLFATKGSDGKPTPIPEDLIAKARSVNELAQKTSSEPERKEIGAESVPYTQITYNDIRSDGTMFFKNTIREINRSNGEITSKGFINSDFVHVTGMSDDEGRALEFKSIHDGDIYRYEVTFNKPIHPGQVVEYVSEGTMDGLVKPVVGSKGEFQYYMKHWPAAGQPTRRVETYLLPAGAELISTMPKDMERRTKDGRIELHVEKMIPPDGSITTSFQYRVP